MNKFTYKVAKDQAINLVRYSGFNITPFNGTMQTFDHPVNLEEGYVQVIYPQRKEFIEQFKESKYDENINYGKIYYPFENPKVEFSTFTNTTHQLKIETEFYIECDADQVVDFEIITCGAVQIFVNGESQVFFAPFTRNIASKQDIKLNLKAGTNKVNVYATELSERDVFFYYELINKSNVELDCHILFKGDVEDVRNKIEILKSLNFDKDIYSEKDIRIAYDKNLLKGDVEVQVYLASDILQRDMGASTSKAKGVQKPLPKKLSNALVEGVDVIKLEPSKDEVSLKEILHEVECVRDISFEIECDDENPVRKIVYTINNLDQNLPEMDVVERKKYIQKSLLANSPQNITKALLLLSQGFVNEDTYKSIDNGMALIDSKGDCADFQFVPLVWLMKEYKDLLSVEYQEKLEKSILEFRFWIDEPGNDAMWWFSENHAFLFHISQYLAGDLYKDKVFTVSNRTGAEQYEIGKKRILDWFEIYNKYGFAEWNSTTYLPVDFIGFATLYKVAPDKEIRDLAKKGMDAIFKIVDINLHNKLMGCTYGRVYEKELKGLRNGELALITWIILGKGYLNKTNRASVLLTLVDYTYQRDEKYDVKNKPVSIYKQGINEVVTYTYKTKNYVLSSAINYRPFRKGHQQHMSHISFSQAELPLWINNPGETVYSGENRPSFWAGNGSNPQNFQDKNVQLLKYDVTNSVVKYMHGYFPIMNFNNHVIKGNKAFAELNDTYVMFATNNELYLNDKGAVKNRELIFTKQQGLIFTVLGDKEELGSFEAFIDKYSNITFGNDLATVDGQTYEIKNDEFVVNGKAVDYKVNEVI